MVGLPRSLRLLLPRSLARGLPMLVLTAYLAGALISGWTLYSVFKRSSAVDAAEASGEVLFDIIESEAAKSLNAPARYARQPYRVERRRGLPEALPPATVPLILTLDERRYRAAIGFDSPPKLPRALQASAPESAPAIRLGALSRAIARQDQAARLVLFLPGGDVLFIEAPGLWQERLSQTTVVLLGALGFALGLGLLLPMARNLATPFQLLSERHRALPALYPGSASEALEISQRIAQLKKQFRREEEKRSRGLAAISHDLRTPVTRMRLRADLVEDEALRDRFEGDLDELSAIIDGALDLLSVGPHAEERHSFSLVALLESLVEDYRDMGRQVELRKPDEVELRSAGSVFATSEEVRVRAENECRMEGQPDKLRRAFTNLVDNALKYGGRALVEVGPDTDDLLKVSVRDYGPGIEPDQLERVILPFVRGHGARGQRGVGLGLSIASEIIALHGGSIELMNTEKGLLVTVQLSRRGLSEL